VRERDRAEREERGGGEREAVVAERAARERPREHEREREERQHAGARERERGARPRLEQPAQRAEAQAREARPDRDGGARERRADDDVRHVLVARERVRAREPVEPGGDVLSLVERRRVGRPGGGDERPRESTDRRQRERVRAARQAGLSARHSTFFKNCPV
jgi:hypothetical protein